MNKLGVFNKPSKELCGAMPLAVLESSGYIVHRLALGHIMLASREHFAMFLDVFLRVAAIIWHSNAEFTEREVLAGGQASSE